MKTTLQGKIVKVYPSDDGMVSIMVDAKGKVEDAPISAKECLFAGTLTLKSLAASNIKIGATITITVSDSEVVAH